MNKASHICILLMAVALLSLLYANICYQTREVEVVEIEETIIQTPTPTATPTSTPTPTPTPKPNRVTRYYQSIIKGCYLDEIPLTVTELELTSLGKYFITAYCPSECGYRVYSDGTSNYPRGWTTASDTICHRASYSERYTEPTTCAISRSIHRFGDTFYIKEFDRVFVAEDTGSAVKGKHLDLFYEEYSDVCSFPTGYYTVYSVEVNTYQVKACKYDVREIIHEYQRNAI